jgi:3alpha(or 20beta)-hydroxysteroid dehydrogenase
MVGLLEGRVALITGAAGGIGSATARLLRAEGAMLALADVDAVRGQVLADELDGLFLPLDVGEESDWTAVADAVDSWRGRLDILVNSAGIFEVAGIRGTTTELFERTMRINQTGTFLGIRACAPLMAKGGGGSIVNLSSAAGLVGTAGTIAYTTSKWAVRGMTKVAALELAPDGIRVNSVHPGGIDTDMTRFIKGDLNALPGSPALPMGRMGEAQEVARMILFLASDQSSFSTGSEFVCDGGLTAA